MTKNEYDRTLYLERIFKDIDVLGINGGYDVEQLLTPQDCRFLKSTIEDLQDIIDKATKFVESMEYCGQEDYFYDEQADDSCGNDNIFDESKIKLLKILEGEDK